MATYTGSNGSDTINGSSGDDTISSGNGSDTVDGGDGNDTIDGGNGDDTLDGEDGNDTIYGGNGRDVIYGGAGNDILIGENGDDRITGGGGDDLIDGNNGFDIAYYSGSISEYTFAYISGYLHIIHQGGAGPNGHDRVIRVERLVFGDRVVNLGGGNDNAPVAVDDHVSITEDNGTYSSGSASVKDNDFDFEGQPLAVTPGTFTGTYGTLTLNADGTYTYTLFASAQTLAEGQDVQDSFNYTVTAGSKSDTGTLVFHIEGVNDAPTAAGDAASGGENQVLTVDVLGNDADIDNGAALTVTAASVPPGQGIATVVGNQVQFDPGSDFDHLDVGETASVTASYTIQDEHGASASSTIAITVHGTNDAPVATDDTAVTNEETSVSGNVLANDSDVDVETLVVTNPGSYVGSYGTLTLAADGSFTYVPAAAAQGLDDGETANDVFAYVASDGTDSDGATLTVTVAGLNDAPVASDDSAATDENSSVSGNVLANDVDVDGETLIVANPGTYLGSNGTLVLAADGSYTYTPYPAAQALDDGEFAGDVFSYVASDGTASDTATLTITVAGLNDPPVANDDSTATSEDAGISGNVLANDTDVDGEPLAVANPGTYVGSYGTLILSADGSYSYTPGAGAQALDVGETAQDLFAYAASDGTDSDGATLTVTVTGLNDAPVANDDGDATDENSPVSGNVLANDTDVDGETLTVANPGTFIGAYGTLVLSANGSYTYTPGAAAQALTNGQTANDVFTYIASDGTVADSATLTVTVSGLSGVPNAVDDNATTTEDASVSGNVLANDTDAENDPITVSDPGTYVGTYGTLTLAANGSYSYVPSAAADALAVGEIAQDQFTYTASDGSGSDTATLTVTITGTNDAPTIDPGGTDASGSVTELPDNDPGEGTTVHSDSGSIAFDDPDLSDTHSASVTPQGSFYLGNFTLDPVDQSTDSVGWDFTVSDAALEGLSEGEVRIQTYTVEIADGHGGTASQEITITITGAGVGAGPQTVWYIDNSAVGSSNAGTEANPYTSIAAFNAAQGAVGGPQAGHTVYLLAGIGTGVYAEADGINLLNNQILIGVDNGAVRPTIEATAGDGINLAQGNTVSGLDIGSTSGAGIADSGGSVGTLVIGDVGIGGARTGQIIDIDQGGLVTITLNSAASSGSTGGAIDLAGLSGDFTVSGATTITGVHSGGGVDVTGSSALVYLAGGGLVSTGAATAINYAGNSGSLVLEGGLDIVTTTGIGLNATGGGALSVSGGGNSIASAGGTALNVAGTTIGGGGITFESISATGGANGIVLSNTGSSGGLTVTGTGVAGSGGAISGTSGAGVSLTNTANVALNWMTIANTGSHGVAGTGVTDASGGVKASFAFENGLIDGAGDGAGESALFFDAPAATNITGRLVVANSTLQNFESVGLQVGNVSGTLVIDVSDVVFNNNSDVHGEEGIDVDASGTSSITLNVSGTPLGLPSSPAFTSGTRFTDLEGGAINAIAQGSGVLDVNISSVLVTGTGGPDNFPTPPAVTLTADGSASTLTFDIVDNRIDDSSGDGIVIGQEGAIEGRITGNTIINVATGDGIRIDTASLANKTATILVQNNIISNVGDDGIQVSHRHGTKTLNLTIDGNTIQNSASEGIRYFSDDDFGGGGPLNRLAITNNVFGNNGFSDLVDSIVIGSQEPGTEIFTEIMGNSGVEGITLRQQTTSFLSVEQASVAALSAANGNATVSTFGTITFNTPVTVPQPTNPMMAAFMPEGAELLYVGEIWG